MGGMLMMVLAPPVVGLVLGLIQLLVYVALVKAGSLPRERIPFFPILWLRGMLVVVVIGVGMGIWQMTTRPV